MVQGLEKQFSRWCINFRESKQACSLYFFVVRSVASNIGGERDVGGVNLYIVILYCAILQQIF